MLLTRRRAVTTWPQYLLKRIPPELRTQITEDALAQDVSTSDVIRAILCRRYRLNCPPESWHYSRLDTGRSVAILLRLQPKLQKRLARESDETGRAMRTIIMDALTAHYGKEPSHV